MVSNGYLALAAVLDGAGLSYVLEEHAAPHLESERLVQVLEDWSEPYSRLHHYYPVGQLTLALRALINALKRKSSDPANA